MSASAQICVEGYTSPYDGMIFMKMVPRPTVPPSWAGQCEIQCWGDTELEALADLFETLEQYKLPICMTALNVAAALTIANTTVGAGTRESNGTQEDWERRPMGLRGPCPRRKRHRWLDPTTGATVHIYADTLKRHADPNCTCPHCVAPNTTEDDTTE